MESFPETKDAPKIRVVVRKRPLMQKESKRSDVDCVEVRYPQTIIVKEIK